MTENLLWEYQVLTIGGVFKTRDETIQETLNAWGEQGWEAFQAYTTTNSTKVTLMAKRPLTTQARRVRSMPNPGY